MHQTRSGRIGFGVHGIQSSDVAARAEVLIEERVVAIGNRFRCGVGLAEFRLCTLRIHLIEFAANGLARLACRQRPCTRIAIATATAPTFATSEQKGSDSGR